MTDDRRDCGFGKDESRRISGSKPEIEQPARVMQAAGEILELCISIISREKASKAWERQTRREFRPQSKANEKRSFLLHLNVRIMHVSLAAVHACHLM
jgi:hypothetical protein